MNTDDEWRDCVKRWPIYRDYLGRWRWSRYTQRRDVIREGKVVTEFRERAQTAEEWGDWQW